MVGPFPIFAGEVKGGVASVIMLLAGAFTRRGHDVHIVTTGRASGERMTWGDCEVHVVNVPRFMPRTITNVLTVRHSLHRIIRRLRPDIVHFQGSATYALNFEMPWILTLHGIPELDARHSDGLLKNLKSALQGYIESYCRRKATNIVIISPYVLSIIGDDVCGRRWIIENPVGCEYFKDSSYYGRAGAVFVGVFSRRKNILGALHIIRKLRDSGLYLKMDIIGPIRDTAYYEHCLSYIASNSMDDLIRYHGPQPPQVIAERLRKAKYTLLFSYQETAPVVIAESMAAGSVVVASDVGGVKHMLQHARTGYVHNPHDHASIIETIKFLEESDSNRVAVAKAAAEDARRRFHVDRIADETVAVYEYIVRTRGC